MSSSDVPPPPSPTPCAAPPFGDAQPRRMQADSCTTGSATSNENTQQASLWLRGPDADGDGGRIVMGQTADVNLYRGGDGRLHTDSHFTAAGNVGVGTTSPDADLEVEASDGTAALQITANDSPYAPKLVLKANSPIGEFAGYGTTGEVRLGAVHSNYFLTLFSGNAERVLVNLKLQLEPVDKLIVKVIEIAAKLAGGIMFRNVFR